MDRRDPAAADAAVLRRADDLGPGLIGEIADGRAVALGSGLLAAVQRQCELARAALAGGQPVYGVNTGMGALSGVALTAGQQLAHQRNLLLGRAVGGPPWLSRAQARAVLAVRLRTLLSGDAGVSAALCERLAVMLNRDLVPAVPRDGIGCAGEIIPLAHAFGPLAGIGAVLADGGLADRAAAGAAAARPAGAALRECGLAPYPLGPKEGIALLAGVPGATALAVLALRDARALITRMAAAAALSIAAVRASRDPYQAACARGDAELAAVLARLRQAVGTEPQPAALQAPVSFRVAGPVLAHLQRAAAAASAAAERALAGVTDSPAFLGGRFTGTAGFHGIDLAAGCDQLTAALAHAAEVSAARLHRLLDPAVTGLPAQLAAAPGAQAGLVAVHKRAAGEVHALRRLAVATPVGLIETSGGQEDVQSFGWEAAQVLREALRHAGAVTACEALAACQAIALSGRPVPAGCRGLHGRLAAAVGPIGADRPFGADIQRLLEMPWTDGESAGQVVP